MDRTETEKMESVRKARGPYRRYNVDPSVPIPKTTLWRMKRSGIEPTGSEDSLHEVGTSSDADSSMSEIQDDYSDHNSVNSSDSESDGVDTRSDASEDSDDLNGSDDDTAPGHVDFDGDLPGEIEHDDSDDSSGDSEEDLSCLLSSDSSASSLDSDMDRDSADDASLSMNHEEPLRDGAMMSESSWRAIIDFHVTHKLTYSALTDLLGLLKRLSPSSQDLPASTYLLRKHFSYVVDGCQEYTYCAECHTELEGRICANPECRTKKQQYAYFITIPFENHLKLIYSNRWNYMLYPFTRSVTSGAICDLHDGSVVAHLMRPGNFLSTPEHTGLLLNTDGVPLFNSSKASLWPVYLAISSLPPTLRMNLDYLMLAGVWCGPTKPPMDVLLTPILKSIRKLASTGIATDTIEGMKVVKGKLLVGIFDLPAKACAANMKQFNGRYGCTYCTDEGDVIGRNTRIYPPDAPHLRRTTSQMEEWADEAEDTGNAVMGVKGKSVLADYLQLPECLPIDYMHSVLEGVFKSLLKSWFDSTNHRMPFYLGSRIKAINRKAKQIQPPSEFSRSIRPLETIAYWKASEFRSWLLHLALPLLRDHLPAEYLNHLALLVCAMHILLSDYITRSDLFEADRMLKTFYQLLPELYPEEMCKPNAHSLIHTCQFVKMWGPLWAYSMFGYESMNGFLKTTFHGTRQVLKQLVFTTLLKQRLQFEKEANGSREKHQVDEHTYVLGKIQRHRLSHEEKAAISECTETNHVAERSYVQVAGRILRESTVYFSCLHSRDSSRNNRVCQYATDDEIGVAEIDYFIVTPKPFAMLKAYAPSRTTILDSIRPPRLHHENIHLLSKRIFCVNSDVRTRIVVPLSCLTKKAVFIKARNGQPDVISILPNLYEHH